MPLYIDKKFVQDTASSVSERWVLIELLDDNATVVHSNIWQLNEKHDFPIFTIEPNLRFKVTAIDGAVETLFVYLKSVNLAYFSHV